MVDDLIQSTADLIASEPSSIALSRVETTSDGAGGRRPGAPVDLEAVDRFFSYVAANPITHFDDGGSYKSEAGVLIGMPDDDIRNGDTFTHNGLNFRVTKVFDDRRYQTKAEVIHIG